MKACSSSSANRGSTGTRRGYRRNNKAAVASSSAQRSPRSERSERGRTTEQVTGFGWRRLDYYFSCAYGDKQPSTKKPGQIRSWCGIFLLWAVRQAGQTTNDWCSALARIFRPKHPSFVVPGDLGYIDHLQHVNIVVALKGDLIYSIDGNTMNYGTGDPNKFTKFAGGAVTDGGIICLQGRHKSRFQSYYDPDSPLSPSPTCPRRSVKDEHPPPVTYPFSL